MATNKHFHVKHGLTVGTGVDNSGTPTREVITNTGQLVDVGALSSLTTTNKTNVVAAINEIADGNPLAAAITAATGEPMGHEDKTHSSISFDNATRTFTIGPNTGGGYSDFVVWTKGTKRTYTSAQTVQIGTATGLYYIYFDALGALQYRTTYFVWDEDTPTAYVYWNATTSTGVFVADERHGVVLDWQTHEYLHRTRGAVIANGFGISNYVTTGDGSADSHAQFDLADGTFFDEDLEVGITHSATPSAGTFTQVLQGNAEIPVYYMSGSSGDWVKDTATEFACKQSATTLQYNSLSGSTWSTTAADNNRYVISWVVATNEINAPIIAILGQNQYSSIGDAEEEVFGNLVLTNFPIFEFRPLWKVIFRTNSTFTNTPNAYIANVLDLREFSSTGVAGTIVNDHGLLSGLTDDDHSQYLHTTVDRTGVTANISTTGNITGANLIATSGFITGRDTPLIRPTLDLNFEREKRLDSRVTFTRASSATYTDEYGVIRTVANNVPRFDHDPTTGESLGLLIEESRTNLLKRSQELDTSPWTSGTATTITANAGIAPDGTNTATRVQLNAAASSFVRQTITSLSVGQTYTYSIYVKNYSGSSFFDLTLGYQTSTTLGKTESTDNWTRYSISFAADRTTQQVLISNAPDDYSVDILAWGAQLEVGSFPTSYIPTTTSTVTRAADEATITGTNFTDWYNASEGSIFAKYSAGTKSSESPFGFTKTGSENTDVIAISSSSSGPISGVVPTIIVRDGDVPQTGVTVPIYPVDGDVVRTAIGYKENDFVIYSATDTESGFVSDSSGTIPTVDIARIGKYPYYGIWQNRPIARILYYPKRLPNAQLQTLTS